MRTFFGAVRCGAAALLTVVASAAAEMPSDVLIFDAPPACGTPSDIRAQVEQLSGLRLSEHQGDARVRATVVRKGEGYLVTVRTWSPSGENERQFSAESCPLARDAVALMVALLLNPDADLGGSAPPEDEEESDEVKPVEAGTAPNPRERNDEHTADRRRFQSLAAIGLAMGKGHLPRYGAAGQLQIGVAISSLVALVQSRLWLPQSVNLQGVESASSRFVLGSSALLLCLGQSSPRIELRACAGPALLVESGRARGISNPAASVAAWGAVRGAARGGWRLSPRLAAVASVGLDLAPKPQSFVIDGLGEVHGSQTLAPHASFSLERRF